METASVHPAEAYLRDSKNPSSLYVKIEGKRRRLFINRESGAIGIIAPGRRAICLITGMQLKAFLYPTNRSLKTRKEN